MTKFLRFPLRFIKSMYNRSAIKRELPPVTVSLSGILKNVDIQEEDYKSYLEEKHLK